MFLVPNRTSNTSLPLIESTCKDGTSVHTDKQKGYNRVNSSMCFTHVIINQSENFYKPQDKIHIQDIEQLWSKFKKQIKNTKGKTGDKLELLLSELMYKNNECVISGFEANPIKIKKTVVYCYKT